MDFSHFITRWFQILCYFYWSLHKIYLVLPPQKKNLKFRKFSNSTRPLWKIIFLKKLSLSTLIMEANIWSSKIISSSTAFPTSPLHHIPLNTMVTLKEDTAISLKLASPYSLMLHFQTPSGLISLLLLFTSLTTSNHHSQSVLPIWINFSQKSQLL